MKNADFECELPRSHEAPWLARRSLGEWFGATLTADELHRAKLLTSELVTNAVLHGTGRIGLGAHLDGVRLVVEVADEGARFQYAVGQRSFDHLHGRGLAIVDAESQRWGISGETTRVWFELVVTAGAKTGLT